MVHTLLPYALMRTQVVVGILLAQVLASSSAGAQEAPRTIPPISEEACRAIEASLRIEYHASGEAERYRQWSNRRSELVSEHLPIARRVAGFISAVREALTNDQRALLRKSLTNPNLREEAVGIVQRVSGRLLWTSPEWNGANGEFYLGWERPFALVVCPTQRGPTRPRCAVVSSAQLVGEGAIPFPDAMALAEEWAPSAFYPEPDYVLGHHDFPPSCHAAAFERMARAQSQRSGSIYRFSTGAPALLPPANTAQAAR